jgi:hypothetical protein
MESTLPNEEFGGRHFYSINGIMSNTLDDFPSIIKSKMK